MLLKIFIVILFFAVLVSLFTGLNFLVKDLGNNQRRLLYALGIRVTLAALLLGTIAYGVHSGQLSSKAPWDRQLHPEATAAYPNKALPKP